MVVLTLARQDKKMYLLNALFLKLDSSDPGGTQVQILPLLDLKKIIFLKKIFKTVIKMRF